MIDVIIDDVFFLKFYFVFFVSEIMEVLAVGTAGWQTILQAWLFHRTL